MLMNNDRPKQVVTKHKVCDYHKKHPGKLWPGCTCFTVYFQDVIERESKDSADLSWLDKAVDVHGTKKFQRIDNDND